MSPAARRKEDDAVSKSRLFNATFITVLTLIVMLLLGVHFIWSVKTMINQPYGNLLNNLVYGPGTFLANVGLSSKLVRYLNKVLVEDKVDADYKKYI
ncbi:uncharacterized protein LODBEIA_P48290 [Lodderomyces beijingensis]|uniref:Vacuolar ATPase assembly integral membrane protein VMA21 n=1 Tax=Lodderomyces beijingensis TaxID=1775926 RepID=A0ABP0ZVU2_9ASCO